MATRDNSLDELIINAARLEFMECGFLHASMRNIASRAGITTGALYRRYKGKDELFESIAYNAFSNTKLVSSGIETLYSEAFNKKSSKLFIEALAKEEKLYLDILFDHYEECYLIMVKGSGSELAKRLNDAYVLKTNQTIAYFTKSLKLNIDKDSLALIMGMQLSFYKEMFKKGYTKEKAISVLKGFEDFMLPSWRALFEEMI